MKKSAFVLTAVVLLAAAGGLGWQHWHGRPATVPAAEVTPSAAITSALPERASTPLTINGYGDLVPAKLESINFPRPGILAALRVVSGQHVRRGDALAQLGSDPVAEATYRQARSALTLAEGELQRARSLFGLQLATASQVQTAVKVASDAQSNLDAQEKLGGNVATSEARAPFDGVVTQLNAAQGDRLAAGAPVLQIGRTDRLKVNLGIEPADRQWVRLGQPVVLSALQSQVATSGSLAGVPGAPPPPVAGRVAGIQEMVDARTQLLNIAVEIPQAAGVSLVPGMRLTGAIAVGTQEGWKLPRSAVLTDTQGAYLFQVAGGKAHRLAVTSLLETAQDVVVSGPLTPDQPVVIQGNYELTEGMAVRKAAP